MAERPGISQAGLTPTLDRLTASALLDAAVVIDGGNFSAADWPIGASMLPFAAVAPSGASVRAAGPDYWRQQLTRISRAGFSHVELPDAWLSVGELSAAEITELRAVLDDLRLAICATAVVRKSVIHPIDGSQNLAVSHEAIDGAAAVGSPLLSLGLHDELTLQQHQVPWFWTVLGNASGDDIRAWALAVDRFRELADHAAEVGVELSLELYEDTLLGTCDSAVAFLADIDRENVGLNPDLGNLIRAQAPIEPWEAMAVKALPHANYWHVKSYTRAEHPAAGIYLSTPSPMLYGLIDYRRAVRFAIANGFSGAFLTENYGGDGLAVSAENARYLRSVLVDVLDDPT